LTGKAADPRYRIDVFTGASLAGNPLGSPAERRIHIYLPPGYYENAAERYPVIYFLHGYDGTYRKVAVFSAAANEENMAKVYGADLLKKIDLSRMPSYPMLDELIIAGKLPPFIFVQPDGSLHVPHMKGIKDFMTGLPAVKGSFYINSPATGNYEDYIIKDVIEYVDSHYRSKADKGGRCLSGASMGGYGTLYLGLRNPDKFNAAAALSPANFTLDLLPWKLKVPLVEMIFGARAAEKGGQMTWDDINDTVDMVFSKHRPLLPTVKKGAYGRVLGYDPVAAENWQRYDLNKMIEQAQAPYKDVALMINCDKDDEFGLAGAAEKLHGSLQARNVKHAYDLYSDPMAALSPHIFGIAYNIIPAVKFCLNSLK
jgi:hypothetical protein